MPRKLTSGEQFVAEFLARCGLSAGTFSARDRSRSKTPDFKVFKEKQLVFYCEVKSKDEERWLEDLMRQASPRHLAGTLGEDPVSFRLRTYVTQAAQQCSASNPDHRVPNVLAILNDDEATAFEDLLQFLVRHIPDTKRDLPSSIDLCLWFERGAAEPQAVLLKPGSAHAKTLCELFEITDLQTIQAVLWECCNESGIRLWRDTDRVRKLSREGVCSGYRSEGSTKRTK
jgi:hypothetical protein